MNKIIAALVALAVIGTPALAYSNMDLELVAQGDTTYSTYSNVAGFDWSEGSMQTTAFIVETITNDEYLVIHESFQNPSPWMMHEYKNVYAEGESSIDKYVEWWTEDSTVVCDQMRWPTTTNVFIGYHDEDSNRLVDFTNVANENTEDVSGEFSRSHFSLSEESTDWFSYEQSVGIGMPNDCDFYGVTPPVMPECEFC